jgi:hypothetical protein
MFPPECAPRRRDFQVAGFTAASSGPILPPEAAAFEDSDVNIMAPKKGDSP